MTRSRTINRVNPLRTIILDARIGGAGLPNLRRWEFLDLVQFLSLFSVRIHQRCFGSGGEMRNYVNVVG